MSCIQKIGPKTDLYI